MRRLDRVAAALRRRTWVDGLALARVGGAYAWRTRVSELRTLLGWKVRNRQRRTRRGRVVSEYRRVA